MEYFVLIILTLISCVIYQFVRLTDVLRELVASYREQFGVMSDSSMPDDLKQKKMLALVMQQLLLLLKLVLGILLFIAPFLSLFLLQYLDSSLNPDILITWWGIIIPIAVVIMYIIFKRFYASLFKNG